MLYLGNKLLQVTISAGSNDLHLHQWKYLIVVTVRLHDGVKIFIFATSALTLSVLVQIIFI
jgi:hypothetical protein